MANAYDIGQYLECKDKAKLNNLTIEFSAERFVVHKKNGTAMGYFTDLTQLYNFICGYEWGYAQGIANAKEDMIREFKDEMMI